MISVIFNNFPIFQAFLSFSAPPVVALGALLLPRCELITDHSSFCSINLQPNNQTTGPNDDANPLLDFSISPPLNNPTN